MTEFEVFRKLFEIEPVFVEHYRKMMFQLPVGYYEKMLDSSRIVIET